VREGLTLAIAEPYNGSSYEGESGESCGECWEIDTLADTRVVMVHDLCPIEGNPLCASGHFHFDLSTEAGSVLEAGGLDEAQARRVPCPVDGNIHIQINDRNEWGYLRLQFVNHRIPIRKAEYRADNGSLWRPVQRSGGAWHVLDDNETFASGAPGGVFRITSAQGEVLECPSVLPYDRQKGSTFDLGAQLTDQQPASGGACLFEPPRVIYDDAYGGIDQVRWTMNPWGGASDSEVTDGCYKGSHLLPPGLPRFDLLDPVPARAHPLRRRRDHRRSQPRWRALCREDRRGGNRMVRRLHRRDLRLLRAAHHQRDHGEQPQRPHGAPAGRCALWQVIGCDILLVSPASHL
jgi:hypothetical protein